MGTEACSEGEPQMIRHLRRLRVLLVLLALVCGSASPGAWLTVAHSYTQAEQSTRYWAAAYNLSGDYMWRVALCESSGNPYAVGPASSEGTPLGLFQVKPATWFWLLAQENADTALAPHLTQYDPESRFPDADAGDPEAHIAAWAFAHGLGRLWECA